MRSWALLAGAIAAEVAATLALRASQDHAAWLLVAGIGYPAAFTFLTLVLRHGVAVGVAYGTWGAVGTASTALAAAAIFGDPLTWPVALGIGFIVAGVLLVELAARPESPAT